MKIARELVAAGLAASMMLMTGCFRETKLNFIDNLHNMTIAISEAASPNVREAAKEFINRAAYYSDGSLQIELKESSNIQQTLERGEANFAFVESKELSQEVECLKTLELPFFFKNEVYHYSGLNSERTLHYLNKKMGENYPVEILTAALSGYSEIAAEAHADFSDVRQQYPIAIREPVFSQELQKELSVQEIESQEPFLQLQREKVQLAETNMEELITAAHNAPGKYKIADFPWKMETAFLLMQKGVEEQLNAKQKAAIQQASVMAGGYCRTLTQQQRARNIQELDSLRIQTFHISRERYFSMMGDIYQYRTEDVHWALDLELDRLIRSDGVQEAC